jgi:hypothetical protein
MNENVNSSMDFYITYEYLTTDSLIEILKPTKDIYTKIWRDIYAGEIERHREFGENIHLGEPQLLIDSIRTGDSVTIKLTEGYTPKIKFSRKGDVELQLPKKMGIVALVGYFAVSTLSSLSGIAKNVLDTQKTFYEKEKARIEYEMKLRELEKLNPQQKSYIDSLNQEKYLSIENSCYELRNVLIKHDNLKSFSVNGIEVYRKEQSSDQGDWQIIEENPEE